MLEGEEVYYDRTEVVDVDGQLWEGDFRNILKSEDTRNKEETG